jgi:hypothetical protein
MSDASKKNCKIHHPKANKHLHSTHFAAFGTADKGTQVGGKVIEKKSQKEIPHLRRHLRTSKLDSSQVFWILRFEVQPVQGEEYTLKIIDEDGGQELGSTGIDLSHAQARQGLSRGKGIVEITFPHDPEDTGMGNPLPLEFAAYGTADPAGPNVKGTLSNCDPATDIEQADPPEDWTLDCFIVNPQPPCTLTVEQTGSLPADTPNLFF